MVQDHDEGIPIKGYRGLRPPGDLIYSDDLFCVETLDLYVSSPCAMGIISIILAVDGIKTDYSSRYRSTVRVLQYRFVCKQYITIPFSVRVVSLAVVKIRETISYKPGTRVGSGSTGTGTVPVLVKEPVALLVLVEDWTAWSHG